MRWYLYISVVDPGSLHPNPDLAFQVNPDPDQEFERKKYNWKFV